MIGAKVMLSDDTEIASIWLNAKPSSGEYLWLSGGGSFTVLEVAHWVSAEWSPNTHTGQPTHSLAIYVQPTER